jgi:branched-chain amino acid transport system permease protein
MQMPVRNPNDYRDKTADFMDFFNRARVRELAPLVDTALLVEHAEDPRGGDTPHSAALQDVLNHLHYMPTDGKSFAYAEVPYQRYRLGILRARGTPPSILEDRVFASEREAVHAVFLQRLTQMGLLDGGKGGAA